MIAINLPNIKNCMAHLLLKNTFDDFSFIEGEIVTANTFTINGFLQKNFFSEMELTELSETEYTTWNSLREYCFSIIKGKRTPLSFKVIFRLSPKRLDSLLRSTNSDFTSQEIQGLYLNIKFDGSQLICITGTSFKTFVLDKSVEKHWDLYVQNFLDEHHISYELMGD